MKKSHKKTKTLKSISTLPYKVPRNWRNIKILATHNFVCSTTDARTLVKIEIANMHFYLNRLVWLPHLNLFVNCTHDKKANSNHEIEFFSPYFIYLFFCTKFELKFFLQISCTWCIRWLYVETPYTFDFILLLYISMYTRTQFFFIFYFLLFY